MLSVNVVYLHSEVRVIHRDVKSANVLRYVEHTAQHELQAAAISVREEATILG